MLKQTVAWVAACAMLALGLAGCASGEPGPAEREVDYADDEAMAIIAQGWNERGAIIEGVGSDSPEYFAKLREGVQAEIDRDAPLKERQFEDPVLQEKVLAYLNALDAQAKVLNNYNVADYSFYEAWRITFDDRSALLKSFVQDYGMTVDPKYQHYMDDIVASGTAVENKGVYDEAINGLVSSLTWEQDGTYGYVAIAENTSDYDFESVYLLVSFYDSDGVKTESFASVNSWKKGEKVKFDVFSDSDDVQRIETAVDMYEVIG